MILDIYFPSFGDYLMRAEPAPALSKLAAIGDWQVDASRSIYPSLCQQFGVKPDQDWPLAALARAGENLTPSKKQSFLVHPSHFVLQRDHFTLSAALSLNADEQAALLATLNAHFSQDGLFFELSQSAIYLHVDQALSVKTSLLAEVLGRDVRDFMPSGQDGMKLQSMINEVQMLFHEHPVNQAREQVGALPVNSLWVDGGSLPQKLSLTNTMPCTVFANDMIAKGLANMASQPCYALPNGLLEMSLDSDILLVMDGASELESAWFVPLLQVLKQSKIQAVHCYFDVHGYTYHLNLRPRDTWKFWRGTPPIATYFNKVPHT